MNEFFTNVGNWFIENKDAILLWLQSIGLGGIVAAVTNVIVACKRIKTNTLTSNNLLEALPIVGETKQSMDALVETESVKSQTIKDETIRTTVGNVLTNAKYNETQTRAKLLETIAALKKKVEESTTANNEEIAKTLAEAQALIQPITEVVHTVVPRG